MPTCDVHPDTDATARITQVLPIDHDNETVHVCSDCLDADNENVDEFFSEETVEKAHRPEVEIL